MEKQSQHYLSRLIDNPSDRRPLYGLVRVFAGRGDWSGLVHYLHAAAGEVDSEPLKARLLVCAGEAASTRLGNPSVGQTLFESAMEMSGDGGVAMAAQLGLLGARGEWKTVMQLCQQALKEESDTSIKADALFKMGEVYRDQLQDKANAIKAFQMAFKTDQTLYGALAAARDIYAEAGKWDLVAQLCQLEAQQLQKDEDAWRLSEVLGELAAVMLDHLEQGDKASLFFQNAYKLNPANAEARAGLRRLGYDVPEPQAEPEAAPESAVSEDSGDVSIDVDGDEDEDEDEDEAIELADEPAAAPEPVAEARSADEDAMAVSVDVPSQDEAPAQEAPAQDEAPSIDVADEAAEASIEVEAEEAVEEEAAAQAAAEEVSEAAEEAVEVEAAEEAEEAIAVEESIEEAEEAEAAPESIEEAPVMAAPEAAEAEPAAEPAVEAALEAEAEAEEEEEAEEPVVTWEDQVADMVEIADEYSGVEALDAYLQALRTTLDHDETHPLVATLLDKALGSAPEFEGFYETLSARLHGGADAYRPLLHLMERHAEEAGGESGANLRRQAVELKLYEMGDVAGAEADIQALAADGIAGALADQLAEVRLAESGSWRRLQQELGSAHEGLGNPDKAERVYGRMAAIARGLGQPDREIDSLRHLLSDAPRAMVARARLKRLYSDTDKWNATIELLKEELGFFDDGDVEGKVAHLLTMVAVYRDHLKLDVMVINTYNQILELDPNNRPILLGLAEQYEAMRRYPDLIGVIQRMAELATRTREKIELNLRVANLFLEKFSNQAEAIKAFEAVLELDPKHAEAIDFLKKMYERRRDWEKLIDVHIKEIDTLKSADDKGARYKEVADLATQRLRKPEVATELWMKVLDFTPRDLDALNALEQLYERNKDWENLADISERKLAQMDDTDKEKVRLAEKLGRLYSERMDAPDKAIAAWQTVLELEADNRKGIDSLKRLLIDKQDWEALEKFYAKRSEHDQYVRILETLAGTVKEDDVKVELLIRSARVWREHLDQTDRAVRSLERILSIDANSLVAARSLAPIYEEAHDAKKLAQVLEIVLGHLSPAEAPEEVRGTLTRLARLQEEDLRNPQLGFAYYSQAFALTPLTSASEEGEEIADASAYDDIERIASSLSSWEDLVSVYQDRLDVLDGEGATLAARELRLRIGRVLNAELGRTEEALDFYDQVLAEAPDEMRALSAEEEIFQKTGNWTSLMDICDRRLALTDVAEERIAIYLSKAVILEEQNEAYADAVDCYVAVTELDPEHLGALQSLHRLYEALEDYPALAEIIRREIGLAESTSPRAVKAVDGLGMEEVEAAEAGILKGGHGLSELVTLKVQLGLVASQGLGGADAEREALDAFIDVLAVEPHHEQALAQAEALGGRTELELDVANTLDPLYVEFSAWPQLVDARETQLRYLPMEEVEARVSKLESIGAILVDQLGDFEQGFEAYGRALTTDPSADSSRERLEQIADAIDDWGPYVALLEDIVGTLADGAAQHAMMTRIARAIEGKLADGPRAQDAWRRVLELSPEDGQALLHLETLYMDGQQWHDLLEVYHRRLALAMASAGDGEALEDPDAAADALEAREQVLDIRFKMAMVHEEMLEDPTGAIEIYRTILSETPDNLLAARALDRLLGGEGRFDELADNLNRQLSLVEDAGEKRALKCRLAGLMETHLGQVLEAITLYAEVLSEAPDDAAALQALEALIETEPDFRLQIVDVIEPLYEAQGDWERLIHALEIRIEESQDPASRIELLHAVAKLHEQQLGSPEAAFATVARAVVEDVTHADSMAEIYRLAMETGLYPQLVDVLEEQVQNVLDTDVACDLNVRIAQLQEDQLGDIIGATDHYRRVMELRPDHMDAIQNLERIYTATQEWQELVDISLTKVSLLEDVEERRNLLHHAATIYEEMLEDPSRAIEVYQRVLMLDEFDGTSIEALERLFLAADRWMDLIELYARKIRMAGSDEERKQLYFVIGSVYESELQDLDQAISTYRSVLDVDPDDRQALESLDRLFESSEQWNDLLETLERQIALTSDAEGRLSLKHRVGELWEKRLYDPVRAIEVYREILEENPAHAETAVALEGMIERGEEQVAAAEVLEPIYREGQQWAELIGIYEILIESSDDLLRKSELLKEVGQIYELRLMQPPMAFMAFGRAMAVMPDDEGVLDTLERLASELEGWEELIALMDEQVGQLSDYGVVRRVVLRMGRILEEELFDTSRAIDRYRMVMDIDPTTQEAVLALDRLYEREGRWHDLAEILQTEIMQAEDDTHQIALRFRLGTLYESALEDVDQAIRTYHDILLTLPEHAESLEALERMFASGFAPMQIGEILEPIYVERDQWQKLVDVFLVQLEHKEMPDERFAHLYRIADIYREQLNDNSRAFYILGNALAERPGDLQVIEELEALAAEIGMWEDLSAIYSDAIEHSSDPDEQKRLWLKVAEVLDHKLGDLEHAEAAYVRVLEMDYSDEASLEALDRIYTQQGRWPDLAEVLRREIELSLDEQRVMELSYRLGTLYEQQLGDLDAAVTTYNNILDINPTHADALSALESIYMMQERWEPLFDVYQRQTEILVDEDEARAEVFAKMADLADGMLFRPHDAIDLWSRVLDLLPTDLTAMQSLGSLYEREERPGDLVSILERQVELVSDDSQRIELLTRVGYIWLEQLYNEDQSLDAYQRVLQLDPDNLSALYACRELYRRTGQYEQLVSSIERIIMLATAEAEELKELYIQLGQIQGDLLGRTEDAIRAWTAVLELEPSNGLALDSLERLYSDDANWEACVDILDRKVQVLEASGAEDATERQIDLHMRIADMWENQIGNKAMAISSLEAVGEIDPANMEASRSLELLYLDAGEYNKLVELLLLRRDYIEDAFDRVETMRRAASIYEENLGNHEASFLVLCGAFMEAHTDEQIASDLERLARTTGTWEELVSLYMNLLESIEEASERVFLHKKVAKWLADELNYLDQSIDHFNQALEIAPDDIEAMADLERIYERTANWQALVEVMQRRARLTPEIDTQIELYRKIGDLYDLQLDNAERAIWAYSQILMIDEQDLGALESLERIYQLNSAWPQLIEVLQRKASVVFEPDLVVEIKFQIATIQEQRLQDLPQAVECYRDVLTIDQTHKPSMVALEGLYERLERWHDLLDVYDIELSMAQEALEQIDLYWKTARVYEAHFADRERAVEAYGKILLVHPHHVEAIVELERLYQDLERWNELVDTYERHIEAVSDPQSRIDLYQAMGIVFRDYLQDLYRAIESNQRILEVDGRNVAALTELANLYETASDWESCLGSYERLSQVVTDIEAGVEIHYKMGRIFEENLSDGNAAEERYRFALELQPFYKPALDALRLMYERREDWPGVVMMLKQEEEYTVPLPDKARLLCDIGNTYNFRLGDEVSAIGYYEHCIELDPHNVEAADPLSRMYLRERRWARAEPLLELLVKERAFDRADPELHLLNLNLARCLEELGQDQRAVQQYQQAYELDGTHTETVLGLGGLYYKVGDFVRAFKVLQTLSVHHAHVLDPSDLVEVYYKCGEIKRQTNETRFAQQFYEKALETDPYHVDTLARLVEMNSSIGQWDLVVEYKRRQLQRVEDPLERFSLLNEIGDIFRDEMPDPEQSVMAYHEAMKLQPNSMSTLRKLLDLYTRAKMWPEAIQSLIRITEVEQDEAKLAKYYYTIGVMSRDQLGDAAQAVDYFNRALDVEPVSQQGLKAFEATDRILTTLKEWKELERAYRKQLHRLKDIPDDGSLQNLKLLLWKNLGEIYRTRMNNFEGAIQTYKIAAQLSPEDTNLHEILADLYERTGTNLEEAILEHKTLIAMSPFRIQSYRSLFNAYMKLGKYDEAWCMASALTFLQSAEKEEQEFYQRYLGQNLQAAKRALTNEHWKVLYDPAQDMLTSQIMGIIGANMRDYYAFDYKTWTLHKRKDLLDPNQQLPFCKIYLYAARTLGLNPPPLLYLKRDGSILGMRNANLDPPAFIVGADMFQGRQDRELGFIIGKAVALGRPEHYLAGGFFPTANLKAFFLAAMQLTNPTLNLGANDTLIQLVQEMQRRLPPPIMIQLQKNMQQFFQSGQNPNLSAWLTAVENTANRVGLLLCGDLMTAASVIKNEQASVSKLTTKEKIKELVVFAISDEYFALRKELGLALG